MKYLIFVVLMLGTALLILLSGFALPTAIALLVFVLAITSDFYTTHRCLKNRGREGNPMVGFLFKRVGVYKTFGLMAVFWVCIIWFKWLPSTEGVQTAVALVYWLVPINNLIVLRKLSKRCPVQS